jgi:hypothetical protein
MLYFQIAAAIVSILLGLTQITKESAPIVSSVIERHHEENLQKQIQARANTIANMNISWAYRGNDGSWRYYADPTNTYWCRVNIEGIQEYSQNPATIIETPINPAVQIARHISNRYN